MSLIVPAYNEEERSYYVDETLSFLKEYTKMKKNKGFTYEIIIVDDEAKTKHVLL